MGCWEYPLVANIGTVIEVRMTEQTVFDVLDRLIAEAAGLEKDAISLQEKFPGSKVAAAQFRERYLTWLNEGYGIIPEYFRPRFWKPYKADNSTSVASFYSPSIERFITSPLATRIAGGPRTWLTPFKEDEPFRREWASPIDTYFIPLFDVQRNVLSEVRAYWRAQLTLQRFSQTPAPSLQGLRLHPRVLEVAEKRFIAGHFDDAVMHCFIAVNEAVREKAQSEAADGVQLMQQVFSPKRPQLRISDKEDEQRAFMDLFCASWSAFRNPRAHSTATRVISPEDALELIAFASALLKLVDAAVHE